MKPGRRARTRSRHARTIIFAAIAAATLAAAGYMIFLKPRVGPEDAEEGTVPVTITMAGFSPDKLRMIAGEPLRVTLVNPDNSHHSDGGGWHDFVLEALGVDVRVAPESVLTFTIPAAEPGEYAWYCDICCGGNANPSMWGMLIVEAA